MIQKKQNQGTKKPNAETNNPAKRDESLDAWETFWFSPSEFSSLRQIRIGLGILSLLYVISYQFASPLWFGSQGLMSTETLGQLVVANEAAAPAFWRWSILHWLDSPWSIHLFFACITLCSLAFTFGKGGRFVALALWVGIVSIANAGWVLAEVGMIPLNLGLASFIIAGLGGKAMIRRNASVQISETSETNRTSLNTLARRLLQFHFVGFLLAMSLSIIANENPIGEGLRRQLIAHGFEWLPAQIGLCRLLHGFLVATVLLNVPVLIFVSKWRSIAVAIICGTLIVLGWLSTDLYFAFALACMSLAFIDLAPAPQTDKAPSPIPLPQ